MFNFAPYSNAKVTLELRELLSMKDENGQPFKLFDFDYPSYYKGDEKTAFEQKIIDHYFFRQIGSETPGRFKHNLKTRLREIMPYYLDMYKTVEIMSGIEDPFGNVDIVETFEQETTGSASGQSSGTSTGTDAGSVTNNESLNKTENGTVSESVEHSENKNVTEDKTHKFSNTPQGSIVNLDTYLTEGSIDDNTSTESLTASDEKSVTSSSTEKQTVTAATESENTSSASSESSSSSESSGTVKHTLTRKGNQGVNTYAHDMVEFRKSIINVDMMIINELNDLFLLVY